MVGQLARFLAGQNAELRPGWKRGIGFGRGL